MVLYVRERYPKQLVRIYFKHFMINSIFLLSPTGEVLIERHFRGVTSRSICDYFWEKASASLAITGISTTTTSDSLHDSVPPILEVPEGDRSLFLFNILRDGLSYLAACPAEVSPLLILEFLHRVADTFQDYFGTPADESAIKENFSTVYQLLEEMVDYGWPLTTEPNALKAMIRPPTMMEKFQQVVTGSSTGVVANELPNGTISNMPWRKAGVSYQNNEVYIDIVEEIDTIVDVNGRVISSDISGSVQVQSQLSGVPDVLLTFKDPSVIDDCSFHPCVRYGRFEMDKVVSFVPPDGNFELMRYRVGDSSKQLLTPPIFCSPKLSYGASNTNNNTPNTPSSPGRINVTVGVRPISSLVFSQGKKGPIVIDDVSVTIPFPRIVRTANLTVNVGSVLYDEATKVATWLIGKLEERKKAPQLTGTMVLLDNHSSHHPSSDEHPPLQLNWKIPSASVSGAAISGLSLTGENYRYYKGFRNIAKSGNYQIRCR